MDTHQLEELLAGMTRAGASSLHLVAGRPPYLRVQRNFIRSEHAMVAPGDVDELTRDLLFADHRERLKRNNQVDVLYVSRSGRRFRTTVLQEEHGQSLVMRPVPDMPPRLNDLELPEQVASFAQFRTGLVVITGFFGSGKSTTMAALVDRLNQDPTRHIVTIEDPIEYLHPPGKALLHQREVGVHAASYVEGVRQAMRLGGDTLAVADLEDPATLDAALTAVENGCLVLGALDASSVIGALTDLATLVSAEARPRLRTRLAGALRAIAAQTLLPRTHQKGRVPLVEILIGNAAARNAIRQGAFQDLAWIMQRCRGLGMQTSDIALRGLLARHLVTPEDAVHHAVDRDMVLARGTAAR